MCSLHLRGVRCCCRCAVAVGVLWAVMLHESALCPSCPSSRGDVLRDRRRTRLGVMCRVVRRVRGVRVVSGVPLVKGHRTRHVCGAVRSPSACSTRVQPTALRSRRARRAARRSAATAPQHSSSVVGSSISSSGRSSRSLRCAVIVACGVRCAVCAVRCALCRVVQFTLSSESHLRSQHLPTTAPTTAPASTTAQCRCRV